MEKKHYQETLDSAKRAKELYQSGLTGIEIAAKIGKGIATIFRYFKMTGGITNQDKAHHMMHRYLDPKS